MLRGEAQGEVPPARRRKPLPASPWGQGAPGLSSLLPAGALFAPSALVPWLQRRLATGLGALWVPRLQAQDRLQLLMCGLGNSLRVTSTSAWARAERDMLTTARRFSVPLKRQKEKNSGSKAWG